MRRRPWYACRTLVAVPLFIIYFFAFALALPPISDPLAFKIIEDKHAMLEHAHSPRVIFLGGSSLLFGIDGRMIHQQLKCDVVNMGLCFYFLLPYMVREVRDQIHAGDLVVLAPELELWQFADDSPVLDSLLNPYPQAFPWILECSWSHPKLRDRLWLKLRELAREKVVYCCTHAGSIVKGTATWTVFAPDTYLSRALMSRQYMDEYGDIIWHLKMKRYNVGPDPAVSAPSSLNPEIVRAVNQFHAFCLSRGADCVVMPCPIPEEDYRRHKDTVDALYANIGKQVKPALLGSAPEFAYPLHDFFNAHYHLHTAARKQHSQKIADKLAVYAQTKQLAVSRQSWQ